MGSAYAEKVCEKEAKNFCGKLNALPELIKGKSDNASMISVSSAKLTFQCISNEDVAEISRQREVEIAKKSADKCRAFGFKEGTEGFSLCLMQQDSSQAEASARRQEVDDQNYRSRIQGVARAGEAYQKATQGSPSITCHTIGNMTNCY